jgi:hypothetical protein
MIEMLPAETHRLERVLVIHDDVRGIHEPQTMRAPTVADLSILPGGIWLKPPWNQDVLRRPSSR